MISSQEQASILAGFFAGNAKTERDSQIPWEVDIEPIHNCQVVAEQLQWDDVEDPLKAIDCARDYNLAPAGLLERRVVLTADDDWLSLAGGNLRKGRLNLGVERVACHDDDHRHVLVNEGERAVLEFAGEDTCQSAVLLAPI